MKKIFALFVAIFVWLLPLAAHPVNQETAQAIASKFMETSNLQLIALYTTDKNVAAFYIFNTTDGYVIVSADDCETPIIGYSHEGCFDPNNVPVQMEDYLQDFVARIQYGIENHIVADETTTRQWELVKTTGRLNDCKANTAVEPLLTEKWHQGCLYNSLCPAMSGPCDHAEVGCVALAMGQIMHYWKYPNTGWGSLSYYNAGNTYSADFGNTLYDWEHMPDSLTETSSQTEIQAVASLLYHCGVSVMMQYGANGSAANSADVPDALIRYFNYSRRLHRERRSKYNDEDWLSLLKQCLDLQRPIYYSGHGSVGGHAFVCDGYDENDLLHFNWGWGGSANGYFALGNLNPIGVNFDDDNYAILDIDPQYEPWMVEASVVPPMSGTVEGVGGYHIGETCTLTAVPSEGYEFYCWKRNGRIISYETSVPVDVVSDIDNIEAHFFHLPINEIAACYASGTIDTEDTCVSLSWQYKNTEWTLLKQFEITSIPQGGIATDGEHIYISNTSGEHYIHNFMFEKYTMDGEFVEDFDIDTLVFSRNLTYDGNYFYCGSTGNYDKLYRVDLANKTLIDITELDNNMLTYACAYDFINDGFWVTGRKQFVCIDRQGQIISSISIPNTSNIGSINGMGHILAKDGTQHLLLDINNRVCDYNITNNDFTNRSLKNLPNSLYYGGSSIGKYDGKDAFFYCNGESVYIYEIRSTLAQIIGYRLYRAQEEGDTIVLADEFEGASYTDSTWASARAGVYRFGISSIFANGVESEIVWTNPILKTDFGIDENQSDKEEQPVQKVFENGQIIIIKQGERYNILGQRLN